MHEALRAVEFASELERPIDRLKPALHRHRMHDDDRLAESRPVSRSNNRNR